MKERPKISIVKCRMYVYFYFFGKKRKRKKEQFFRPTHIHCTPGLAGLRPAIRHLAQVCRGYVRSVNHSKPYQTTIPSLCNPSFAASFLAAFLVFALPLPWNSPSTITFTYHTGVVFEPIIARSGDNPMSVYPFLS